MKFLQLFKSAHVASAIQDQFVIDKQYKYWRWRVFIGMYVGYIFYYFSRKSYTCIMPLLIQDLGFSKSDLGLLASFFAITYGLSKFLSGIISDRSNPRIFMALGLVMTGILNILFGCLSSVFLFAVLWALNGFFQGWGWPPCAKLLSHWYSQKERGTWWGMWNSSHNLGGALIPLVVGVSAQIWGWRYGMVIPGILCIIMGLFVFICLRDTPASLGLPTIEKYRSDYSDFKGNSDEDLSMKDLLFTYIFNNGYLWVLGIAYFFVYVIRGAINDWSPLFLIETRGYDLLTANTAILWFEIGGVVGSLAAGWASDKIFKGRRGPVNVLFSLMVIGAIIMLWQLPPNHLFMDYTLIFLIGFLIFGPQMLIGIAGAELAHKKAAGTATGFIGWIAYIGMAVSGYPLTKVMEYSGWNGFFLALVICGIFCICMLLPLWSVKSNPKFMLALDENDRLTVIKEIEK